MNNYLVTKIDGSAEVLQAECFEHDKISKAGAVIFYNFNERKMKEPSGYVCGVKNIEEIPVMGVN